MAVDEELIRKINGKHLEMVSERSYFEPFWEDINSWILPISFDLRNFQRNIHISNKIFDGTAINASELFKSGFVSGTTPRDTPWLQAYSPNVSGPAAQQWLLDFELWYYRIFAESNFYGSISDFVKTANDYGTAVLYPGYNKAEKRWFFDSLPIGTFYVDKNDEGEYDTLIREFTMLAEDIVKRWPESGSIPQIDDLVKKHKRLKVLHYVGPRETYDVSGLTNKSFKYESIYYLPEKENFALEEGGFKTFPYIVFSFNKIADFAYGYGSGIAALRSIKTLQQIGATLLVGAQKSVDPAVTAPEDLRGNLRLFPGGVNWVNPLTTTGEVVRPIQQSINLPFGKEQQDDIRQQVKDAYLVQYWMVMANLGANATAYQVSEIQAEKASTVAGATANYSVAVTQLCERIYDIASENKIIPPIPSNVNGIAKVGFKFYGPLTQVQIKYQKTNGLNQFIQMVVPFYKIDPTIGDNVDLDKYVDKAADAFRVGDVLRDPNLVQQIRAARAKAQAAQAQNQQQMQQMQAMAELSSKGGKAPEPGSPASNFMQNVQGQPEGQPNSAAAQAGRGQTPGGM